MSLTERFGQRDLDRDTAESRHPAPPAPSAESVPTTDDELHEYVLQLTGKSIPRRAVCSHHVAPFKFFADAFFQREDSILALAPRAGGKTWDLGLLLYLRCKFALRKIKTLIVASIEQQAQEAYGHVQDFIHEDPDANVDSTLKTKTLFPNRSELKYVTGSESSVRGQHPFIACLDEIDDMSPRTLQVALLCTTEDGSQNVLASTKQHAHGNMQKLEDEIRAAEADDETEAPYAFYSWCLLDCMQAVPNCGNGCGCERVKKGRNEDGSDRNFAQICAGRLTNADGWITLAEAWRKFRSVDKATFNAEMLCAGANTEGLIVPDFHRNRHVLCAYEPHEWIGPVYTSTDLGWENPTATVWVQFVTHAEGVKVTRSAGDEYTIPFGSFVVFSEIYKAHWTAKVYTDAIKQRERKWFVHYGWRTRERYYDVQDARSRGEWATQGITLQNFAPKHVAFQTKKLVELVEDDRLFVDQSCSNLIQELESWTYDPKLDGVPLKRGDVQDHAVDALRYAVANIKVRLVEAKTFDKPENVREVRSATGAGESPWQVEIGAMP